MSDNPEAARTDLQDRNSEPKNPSERRNSPSSSVNPNSNQQKSETRRSSIINSQRKGRPIGNYILGEKLGEGAFGKVKSAVHTLTGERVAVKILEKDRIADVSDVERVAREIHILKLIRHPNIIQLYEIIETSKELFLIMEFADGGELFDYIVKKNRVPEKEASRFFHEIINAIEYIHKLNIVHRDLKPENILLDFNKSVKMVDFGLSNTYKNNQLLKTACGSPCYAAPEMIAGKRYHGLTVDIWSCGVILFALVCGYLPFEDPNTKCLYTKILNGDYTIPKFISHDGRDLIKNILNTDPVKRYTIQDIRRHPWMNMIKIPRQPEGIIIGYHQVPIDHNIMKQLEKYDINLESALKYLHANKHNHITATYYLLLKKFNQNGGKSPADINSSAFDKSLLVPKQKQPAKTNNFMETASIANESPKEKERTTEREKSQDSSVEKSNRSFILNYISLNSQKPRDKIKISRSILNSSSRERDVSLINYSMNGSRGTSKDTKIQIPEVKDRPSVADIKDIHLREANKSTEMAEPSSNKEGISPTQRVASRAQRRSRNLIASINNDVLKEKFNNSTEVGGRARPVKAIPAINESFNSPTTYLFGQRRSRTVNMSVNNDVLNESSESGGKSNNMSFINAGNILSNMAGPNPNDTISDFNTKRYDSTYRGTPKERKIIDPRGGVREPIRLLDPMNSSFTKDMKIQLQKGTSPIQIWPNQPRQQQPQSPSRQYASVPREPVIVKQDNSFNGHRPKIQVGKAGRIRISSNEPKVTRPVQIQSRERDSARITSIVDDKRKVQFYNDNSQDSSGNTSYILNGSFQHNPQNNSFDYYPPNRPSLNNSILKPYQTNEARSRRARQQIVSPINIYNTNLYNIINKK